MARKAAKKAGAKKTAAKKTSSSSGNKSAQKRPYDTDEEIPTYRLDQGESLPAQADVPKSK